MTAKKIAKTSARASGTVTFMSVCALTFAIVCQLVWSIGSHYFQHRPVVRSFTVERASWDGACLVIDGTLCKRSCELTPANDVYKAVQFWSPDEVGLREVYLQFSKNRGTRPAECSPVHQWTICTPYGADAPLVGYASHQCGKIMLSKKKFAGFTPNEALTSASEWQAANQDLWQTRYGKAEQNED